MNCPRCEHVLELSLLGDIELDICPSCKGTWFDDDELRQAKDISEPDANWMDFDIWSQEDRFTVAPGAVSCPRCSKPLCALSYAETKVEVDACPACRGVWLDAEELAGIVDALSQELNTKSFAQYVSAAVQEAVEVLTGPEHLASEWQDLKHVYRLMMQRLFVERPGVCEAMLKIQGATPIR